MPEGGRKLPRKKIAFFCALVAAAGILVLVVVVALIRPPDRPVARPEFESVIYRGSTVPGLKYEHVPGAVGIVNGVTVRINQEGFRGPEIELPKPKGTFRIVVFGDSFAFGQGVPERDTLPAVLERELRNKFPAGGIEVINAGVRGYDMPQYLAVFDRRIIGLDPDLLVLVITEINDPQFELFRPHSEKLEKWEKSWWVQLPFIRPLYGPAFAGEVNRIFMEHVRAIYDPEGPHWPRFVKGLIQIRDSCRRINVPLIAVTFPMMADEDMLKDERALLHHELDRLGIPWVDPRESFVDYGSGDLVVDKRDFHPNALAFRLTAGLLAGPVEEVLKERLRPSGEIPSPAP